jgi:hypothetical protein
MESTKPKAFTSVSLIHFQMTNIYIYSRKRNQQKVQVFNDRYDGMRDAIATLSKSPSGDLKYGDIEARLNTPVFVRAKLKCKRWGFAYRQEQRAVHKLAAAVLGGANVVVAWGNGFGPTNGHASPNKALRRSLSRFFPIVLVDDNTSKKCCEQHARQLTPNYKERTTVVQCPKCKILSRDINAAKILRSSHKRSLCQQKKKKIHLGVPTIPILLTKNNFPPTQRMLKF